MPDKKRILFEPGNMRTRVKGEPGVELMEVLRGKRLRDIHLRGDINLPAPKNEKELIKKKARKNAR